MGELMAQHHWCAYTDISLIPPTAAFNFGGNSNGNQQGQQNKPSGFSFGNASTPAAGTTSGAAGEHYHRNTELHLMADDGTS